MAWRQGIRSKRFTSKHFNLNSVKLVPYKDECASGLLVAMVLPCVGMKVMKIEVEDVFTSIITMFGLCTSTIASPYLSLQRKFNLLLLNLLGKEASRRHPKKIEK